MRWTLTHGDILDVPADVLVCSANVFLNLSGGVGGAILLRHGPAMQAFLHGYLAERGVRHVSRGDVVASPGFGLPVTAVLHAVAVEGFCQTSAEVLRSTVARSLGMAASLGARRVALTAIGTGYGRTSLGDFAAAVGPLALEKFIPIKDVVVCVRNERDLADLRHGWDAVAPPRSAS